MTATYSNRTALTRLIQLFFIVLFLVTGLTTTGCGLVDSNDPDQIERMLTQELVESIADTASGTITVEGEVTVRGNTPFIFLMLETDEGKLYVLDMDKAERQALQPTLPARFRITGAVYADDWNGQTYAHLRPIAIERSVVTLATSLNGYYPNTI